MSTPLRVVTNHLPAVADTAEASGGLAARIQQLQAEARGLARAHIDALTASLAEAGRIADEIARGGEAYPPGVRDLARRLCEDNFARAQTLEAISARA